MNNDSNDILNSSADNKDINSLMFFFKTNILFVLTIIFIIICIFVILCFFTVFNSKIEKTDNPVSSYSADNNEPVSDIRENTKYNSPAEEDKNIIDSRTLGEMYVWYYFDRIVRPDFRGMLYDADGDGAEEYLFEKNTEYFYKKYNGNKLIACSYLPSNTLLASFKNEEELTEECRAKAAEFGYTENDGFTIIPECALVGMTNLKSDSVLLMSKPQENSSVLYELPAGLFVNCLFFYDSEGNFSSDGAYNGTYAWSEVSTNYKGSEIRGFIHADNLILDDKLK